MQIKPPFLLSKKIYTLARKQNQVSRLLKIKLTTQHFPQEGEFRIGATFFPISK